MKKTTIAESIALIISGMTLYILSNANFEYSDIMDAIKKYIAIPLFAFIVCSIVISIVLFRGNVWDAFYWIVRNPISYIVLIPVIILLILSLPR